jgi:outer membrane protein OmpA-like peptidoglycan-associated protein
MDHITLIFEQAWELKKYFWTTDRNIFLFKNFRIRNALSITGCGGPSSVVRGLFHISFLKVVIIYLIQRSPMKPVIILLASFFCSTLAFTQEKMVLHFDFNKSEINPEAKHMLDSMLASNKTAFVITGIEIAAHCDSIGNNHYNDSLSDERAQSVKNYLIQHGLDEKVFTKLIGFGKRQPLNQNANEEERLRNRRVEMRINKSPLQAKQDTPDQRKISEVIRDTNTKVGTTLILRNLNFEGGRHILLERSIPILDDLLKAMHDNPNLKIQINGHICCEPSYLDGRDNDLGTFDLSWQRAKVIYQYLVDHGISADRMSFRGFGASQKLYPYERDAFEKEENRRVEIKIVSK